MGGVALAHDRPADAARLLGSVEALLEMVGGTLQWGARARFERDRDAARTRLGDAAFSAATAEGRGFGLEQAIDYALDEPCTRERHSAGAGADDQDLALADRHRRHAHLQPRNLLIDLVLDSLAN